MINILNALEDGCPAGHCGSLVCAGLVSCENVSTLTQPMWFGYGDIVLDCHIWSLIGVWLILFHNSDYICYICPCLSCTGHHKYLTGTWTAWVCIVPGNHSWLSAAFFIKQMQAVIVNNRQLFSGKRRRGNFGSFRFGSFLKRELNGAEIWDLIIIMTW